MNHVEETQKTLFLLSQELRAMGDQLQSTQDSRDVPHRMRNMAMDMLALRTTILICNTQPVIPVQMTTTPQPAVLPVTMGLFPTMGSLQQVIDLGNSQLPITTPNALFSLLCIYHNTLLEQVQSCKPA